MIFEVSDMVVYDGRVGVIDHFCCDSAYVFFYEEDEYLLIMPDDQGGMKLYCESHDFVEGDVICFFDERKILRKGTLGLVSKNAVKVAIKSDISPCIVREVRKIAHAEKKESYIKKWEFL